MSLKKDGLVEIHITENEESETTCFKASVRGVFTETDIIASVGVLFETLIKSRDFEPTELDALYTTVMDACSESMMTRLLESVSSGKDGNLVLSSSALDSFTPLQQQLFMAAIEAANADEEAGNDKPATTLYS